MILTSPAFTHKGEIPPRHTCEGSDLSPPLTWTEVPSGTLSLVLVVDDPDAPDPRAPVRTWVHWIVFNIPPTTNTLPEGGSLPDGARHGLNDWKRPGYGGPCPPIGRHRYFFKLYALDTTLPALTKPTKAELEQSMRGHVLDSAELIGTYQKRNDAHGHLR